MQAITLTAKEWKQVAALEDERGDEYEYQPGELTPVEIVLKCRTVQTEERTHATTEAD